MRLLETAFTAYEFTDEEDILASVFNEHQLGMLLTERTRVAEAKLTLAPDPDSPSSFGQEHEYMRGKLEMLTQLINTHHDNLEKLKYLHQQQALSQNEE